MNLRTTTLSCALILTAASLSLSACSNTFHGAGKDIERAGEAVQDATR